MKHIETLVDIKAALSRGAAKLTYGNLVETAVWMFAICFMTGAGFLACIALYIDAKLAVGLSKIIMGEIGRGTLRPFDWLLIVVLGAGAALLVAGAAIGLICIVGHLLLKIASAIESIKNVWSR